MASNLSESGESRKKGLRPLATRCLGFAVPSANVRPLALFAGLCPEFCEG